MTKENLKAIPPAAFEYRFSEPTSDDELKKYIDPETGKVIQIKMTGYSAQVLNDKFIVNLRATREA